ncbi:hypothetical protein AB0J63_26375 [Streptosporangium canum]|uniref:hypothetical protein n=1 Tax=Streptosporangium canum TaxID=324952 RepID=UPI0034457B20
MSDWHPMDPPCAHCGQELLVIPRVGYTLYETRGPGSAEDQRRCATSPSGQHVPRLRQPGVSRYAAGTP